MTDYRIIQESDRFLELYRKFLDDMTEECYHANDFKMYRVYDSLLNVVESIIVLTRKCYNIYTLENVIEQLETRYNKRVENLEKSFFKFQTIINLKNERMFLDVYKNYIKMLKGGK